MKNFFKKYGNILAALAMVITTVAANSTCVYYMYQDELPTEAKKLRKF